MASVATDLLGLASHRKPRIEEIPCNPTERDTAYTEEDSMALRKAVTEDDYREAMVAQSRAMTLMMTMMTRHEEREVTRPSEMKRLWLPICAAVLISLGPPLWTANVMTRSNSDDFKNQLIEMKSLILEAKRDAGDAAHEAKRANINYALLDVYNRELERSLIRKGITLPTYPTLEK